MSHRVDEVSYSHLCTFFCLCIHTSLPATRYCHDDVHIIAAFRLVVEKRETLLRPRVQRLPERFLRVGVFIGGQAVNAFHQ